jgi:stress response protein SCP2
LFTEPITVKENLGFLSKFIVNSNDPEAITNLLKTSTDVLRAITAYSDGDISLASNTKFKKMPRRIRRAFCSAIDNICKAEDMLKYRNKWIRVGEILHPGEPRNKGKYPAFVNSLALMRSSEKIDTFNSRVEGFITGGDYIGAAQELSKRPGEFARRLNQLLGFQPQNDMVIGTFEKIANKLPIKLLLELRTYFTYRNTDKALRFIMPKGKVAKAFALENKLKKLDEQSVVRLLDVITKAIYDVFCEMNKDKLTGKVYVDPILKDYPIPFGTRSAASTIKQLSRGTKMRLNKDSNIIRMFIYWKNADNGPIDLDLSAVMIDEDWDNETNVSYTNLRDEELEAYHSGDIRTAPKGASEFIDINCDKILKGGYRYVMMNVLSYTNQPFNEIPICYAGWMERNSPNSGEIYEPKTVEEKFSLLTPTTRVSPMILDAKERTITWMDMTINGNSSRANNVEGIIKGIKAIGRGFLETKKPTLYDLFTLNAEATGTLVDRIEDADITYNEEHRDVDDVIQ